MSYRQLQEIGYTHRNLPHCIECQREMYRYSASDLCPMCKRRFLFSLGLPLKYSIKVRLVN